MGGFRWIGRVDRGHPFFGEILYFFFKRILSCINNSFYITSRCPGRKFLNFVDRHVYFLNTEDSCSPRNQPAVERSEGARGGRLGGWKFKSIFNCNSRLCIIPVLLRYSGLTVNQKLHTADQFCRGQTSLVFTKDARLIL